MIAILDYGMGNVKSVQNMLKKVGHKSIITSDIEVVKNADKYILPGVGSFDHGVKNLKSSAFFEVFENEVLNQKKPVLGICLGMQLLTNKSEEGTLSGLKWIDAETKKFNFNQIKNRLPIPHMGWNTIDIKDDTSIFKGLSDNRFYFVHSYYVACHSELNVLATVNYGTKFTCSIHRNNIYGVQFHPEKSHKFGMKLLKNFGEL